MAGSQTADVQQLFLEFFKGEKYRQRLAMMAVFGSDSLTVDFEDLSFFNKDLADALLDRPDELLKHACSAAYEQLRIEAHDYAEKVEGVRVMVRGLPLSTPLRGLDSSLLGKLVQVEGIVVRSTPVRSMVVKAAFQCRACGEFTYVEQSGSFIRQPYMCANPSCHRRGPFDFIEGQSTFVDYQELRIQERPEELPPGQLPRMVNVKAVGKGLMDRAKPGDHAVIVGVVRPASRSLPKGGKLRVFSLYLEANSIEVSSKEPEAVSISPEEEKAILELAKDPWIHKKIIQSIAPSIHGLEHVKEAIALQLFGGVPKRLPDVRVRGELNILLVGDPGTAKSQLLQHAARLAPRGLYTSGRGTTAAGLTAAVLREKQEGGMTLEAGALVLADRGLCAIDEIEKMRNEDRVAIHEVMEQHTVSVAKGGIVATLNARTAVLAAANPALGRYEPRRTLSENISLPITILSRFDLIFILRDEPNEVADAELSGHVLSLHKGRAPPVQPPIPLDLLRKYVAYARRVEPVLTDEAIQRIQQFYLEMRAASGGDSPIAITVRQLESLIRLAEAHARMALRSHVTAEDAEAAVLLMRKCMEQVGIDVSTGKFDADILITGKPSSMRDKMSAIISIVAELERKFGYPPEKKVVVEEAERRHGMAEEEAQRLISQLVREGTLYEPRAGLLKKV